MHFSVTLKIWISPGNEATRLQLCIYWYKHFSSVLMMMWEYSLTTALVMWPNIIIQRAVKGDRTQQ